MTIVSIETSTSECSVSLSRDGVELAARHASEANHAATLPTMIEAVREQADKQGLEIDAIALSEGPGSYTGLRIGAAMAKGLCYGWNIPLIPISTLHAMAYTASATIEQTEIGKNTPYLLCPMIDARRMEVYCAIYDHTLHEVIAPKAEVVDEHSFHELLNEHIVYFFGNGADKCQTMLRHPNARFIDHIVPNATAIAVLAQDAKQLTVKEAAYFNPFYLKDYIPAPSHVKGLE